MIIKSRASLAENTSRPGWCYQGPTSTSSPASVFAFLNSKAMLGLLPSSILAALSSALQVGLLHGFGAERSRPRGPVFRIRTAKLSWAFGPAARRGTGNFRGAHRKTGFGSSSACVYALFSGNQAINAFRGQKSSCCARGFPFWCFFLWYFFFFFWYFSAAVFLLLLPVGAYRIRPTHS